MSCGLLLILTGAKLTGQTNAPTPVGSTNNILAVVQGTVEVARAGTRDWVPARMKEVLYPGDRVRTGERSRAEIYLAIGMTIQEGELSEVEVPPSPGVTFKRGLFKVFSRDKARGSEIRLPSASAAIRGTDFLIRVAEDGTSELTVIEGEVVLRNPQGELVLKDRERGTVDSAGAPRKTAVLESTSDLIQWSLYYPAVLHLGDLKLEATDTAPLGASFEAYRTGDLLRAVAAFPWDAAPSSEPAQTYRAALLLSVGQVEEARKLLGPFSSSTAQALSQLIAVVKLQDGPLPDAPSTASEWLAESFRRQSRFDLRGAREAAHTATRLAPDFGFSWARLAELEFSFGNLRAAQEALERGLELSPRNAQAIVLQGFLFSAQKRIQAARGEFERAMEIDGALANAWLGRGLCLIHEGRSGEGLRDLIIAASLESQRSLLRSYLGKAFSHTRETERAEKELALARKLDPQDPTPWFYQALLDQEQHRLNDGVVALEKSLELSDNRQVYRSRFLLDQDRAVRSASLAEIYQRSGMNEVSLREAARAVTADYANHSAHLFLANSYDALRDPTRFNLRYETPWFNELLLANLLAPEGVSAISPNISQQEYFRLFERDGLGLASTTELRSDGQYREFASQFGSYRSFSYSLDLDWQHNDGVRPNNELDRLEWYSHLKFQLTPHDSILAITKYQDYHSGDNFQYFDPEAVTITPDPLGGFKTNTAYRPFFSYDEDQKPIVLGGYHREWAPGIQTLVLGGRLVNDQLIADKAVPLPVFSYNPAGQLSSVTTSDFDADYENQLEIWIAEVQQLYQTERNVLILGGRFQTGTFDTKDFLTNVTGFSAFFPATDQGFEEEMQRWSLYAYDTWEIKESRLWLTAGLTYDEVTYPSNFRQIPIAPGESAEDVLGPKAALVWSPSVAVTLRGAYSRSLGGVSLDESYRLEPSQLAGFSQSYRSILSESVAGSVSAPTLDIGGAALDLKFKSRTYIGLIGEILRSDADRDLGIYGFPNAAGVAYPSTTPEQLDYDEYSALLTVNQLLGESWSVGFAYKFTRSELETRLPEVPTTILPEADQFERSDLHMLRGYLLYYHRLGFFARGELDWYIQTNDAEINGIHSNLPEDDFPQLNFWIGYRFRRNLGSLAVGLLNATDTDYRLNPLNPYPEFPRERVVAGQIRFRF